MTNKSKIGSIVLVAVLIISAVVWRLFFYTSPLSGAQLLPDGALSFVRVDDWKSRQAAIINSPFMGELKKIDIVKVLNKNNVPQKDIDKFQNVMKDAGKVLEEPGFQLLTGRQFVVAVYPSKNKPSKMGVVILTRLSPQARLAQWTGQLFAPFSKSVTIEKLVIDGSPVQLISSKGRNHKIYYWTVDDWAVMVLDQESLASQVLGISKSKSKTLADNEQWRWVYSQAYAQDEAFVYLDSKLLLEQFLSRIPGIEEDPAFSKHFMEQADALGAYGISYKNGSSQKIKFLFGINAAKTTEELRQMLVCPPSSNEAVGLVPSTGVLYYQWSNCFDLKKNWGLLREKLQDHESVRVAAHHIRLQFEKKFNVDVERDVVPIIGQDMGGYLSDIDTSAMFPYPRFLAFIRVNDKAKATAMMEQMFKKSPVAVSQEQYNGANLSFVSLPLGANTEPGYCFLGDYLVVSSSRQLMKKSVDAYSNKSKGFINAKIYKELDGDPAHQLNSVSFIKWDEMSRRIKDVAGWGDRWFSSQMSSAATYRKEAEQMLPQIDESIKSKQEELKLGQKKLAQKQEELIHAADQGASDEQKAVLEGLSKDIDLLKADIDDLHRQYYEAQQAMTQYDQQAASAKVMMFNVDYVLIPILNAFGSWQGQLTQVSMDHGKGVVCEVIFK